MTSPYQWCRMLTRSEAAFASRGWERGLVLLLMARSLEALTPDLDGESSTTLQTRSSELNDLPVDPVAQNPHSSPGKRQLCPFLPEPGVLLCTHIWEGECMPLN